MISLSVLFNVLALVLVLGVLYYLRIKISLLNDLVACQEKKILFIEEKVNKKDPYEDYRNSKGLLSVRAIKEAKYGKS